jgi:FAD/FMN-containing dehydrogenase
VPVVLPNGTLNSATISAFNSIIYGAHRWSRPHVSHPEDFFYPLDRILNWNRIYGPSGFTQYQCVLPDSAGPDAARRFLEVLTAAGGAGSFLTVLKDCSAEGQGLLSFPRPGVSIALDIAVRKETQSLVDRLNEAVIREGGRIYLAKDSFTRAEHFRAMEPRLSKWNEIRRRWDPGLRIRSAQSVRVLGDPA